MSISPITRRPLREADINVSFEFFPPKSEKMEQTLWNSIERLEPLGPSFVSVTYGAGGSTRKRTHDTVSRICNETSLTPAAHLTCIDASREEVDEVIRDYWKAGVRHFVALRGDPANGVGSRYRATPDGYQNAAELVAGLKAFSDFEITVAAYPERHPESPDFATDIDMLKRKVDNGATRAITQFFFDNDVFEAYVERVRRAGIYIPIVPGIAPIHNFKSLKGFAAKCGTHVPSWLAERFEGLENQPDTEALIAAAVGAEQALDLVARGFSDFHFYTMNRADLVYAICHMLGLRSGDGDADNEESASAEAAYLVLINIPFNRHVQGSAEYPAAKPHLFAAGHSQVIQPIEKRRQSNFTNHFSGDKCAKAKVGAGTKGQVRCFWSGDVKLVCFLIERLLTAGGGDYHSDPVALLQRHTSKFGIAGEDAWIHADGRLPANGFFKHTSPQGRLIFNQFALFRVD